MQIPQPEEPNNIPRPPLPPTPTGAGETTPPQPVHPNYNQAGDTADLSPPADTPPPRVQRAAPNLGAASLHNQAEQPAAVGEPSVPSGASPPEPAESAAPSQTPEATEATPLLEAGGPGKPPIEPPHAELADIPETPFTFEQFSNYVPGDAEAAAAAEQCAEIIAALQAKFPEFVHDTEDGANALQLVVTLPDRYIPIKVADGSIRLKDIYFTLLYPDSPETYDNPVLGYEYSEVTDDNNHTTLSRKAADLEYENATAPTGRDELPAGAYATRVGMQEVAVLAGLKEQATPLAFSVEDVHNAYFRRSDTGPATDIAAHTAALDLAKDVKILFARQSIPYDPGSGSEQRFHVTDVESIGYLAEQGSQDHAQVIATYGSEHPRNQAPHFPEGVGSGDDVLLGNTLRQAAEGEELTPFIHVRSSRLASMGEDLEERSDLEESNPGVARNLPMFIVSESIVRVAPDGKATMQLALSSFLGQERCDTEVAPPIAISGDDLAIMMHLAIRPRYGADVHERQHEFREQHRPQR